MKRKYDHILIDKVNEVKNDLQVITCSHLILVWVSQKRKKNGLEF